MSDIVNQLFGGGGQYYPPVQQQGGITPFQEDTAQYGYQEALLADASQFAGSGTGQSTMATQASGGARIGKALQEAKMSDINAGAILSATNQAEQNQAVGNQQNQSELQQLASDAGFPAGFNNPQGGTQSG